MVARPQRVVLVLLEETPFLAFEGLRALLVVLLRCIRLVAGKKKVLVAGAGAAEVWTYAPLDGISHGRHGEWI